MQPAKLVIPRGDWNAYSLSEYLTAQFAALDPTNPTPTVVTYNAQTLHFVFTPAFRLYYVPGGTDNDDGSSHEYLGIVPLYSGTNLGLVSESRMPINLAGPTQLNLLTNISANTIPISSQIIAIPIETFYSEEISYFDFDGGQPNLVMDHEIQTITIRLLDQRGRDMTYWLDQSTRNDTALWNDQVPPWQVTLSIQPITVA